MAYGIFIVFVRCPRLRDESNAVVQARAVERRLKSGKKRVIKVRLAETAVKRSRAADDLELFLNADNCRLRLMAGVDENARGVGFGG